MQEEKDLTIVKTNKCINKNSFVAEINSLNLPLFIYGNSKINDKDIMEIIKENMNKGKKIENEERTYRWIDSKTRSRALLAFCPVRLPRQFESDTLHGLLVLFVKKYAPFLYNDEIKQYDINVKENKLEFSWYELCKVMNIPSTGYYIKKLKNAIRLLKMTNYMSFEDGGLYSRKTEKLVISKEKGISLLNSYMFRAIKEEPEDSEEYSLKIDNNYVSFSSFIIDNLKHEYFKYLDDSLYFHVLPSGIERGIYGYLEAGRYESETNKPHKFIKRKFETLRVGIPVDFKYPSELKRKLRKPLNHLKKIGYLRDWAFGDELMINGKKDSCVYFCFEVSAKEVKSILERKKTKVQQLSMLEVAVGDVNEEEKPSYLKLPEKSLVEELIDRKVDKKLANVSVNQKDKWEIIKYILWVDKQVFKNKKLNTGSLLAFALRREEDLELGDKYEDINNFMELEKAKEKERDESKYKSIQELYKEYIVKEVNDFKNTAEYSVIKEYVLSFQMDRIDEMMANNKKLGNDISKFEEFKEKGEESTYFKDIITKEIKICKGLMTEQEFRQQKINEK